jgi:hypothetical protein
MSSSQSQSKNGRTEHGMRILAKCMLCILLTACNILPGQETEVRVLHQLSPQIQGRSFYVLPAKDVNKQLEHNLYARDVAAGLSTKGMIETQENKADFWVELAFGTNSPQIILARGADKGIKCESEDDCNELKRQALRNNVSFDVESQSWLTRFFTLILIDREKTIAANNKIQRVYEAKATSGGHGVLLPVSRCVINSVMKYFPGQSGQTYQDAVFVDTCKR